MVNENSTTTVTVADVYGRPLANLSTRLGRRQQFSEFRLIARDEPDTMFLTLKNEIVKHDPASDYRFGGPRLVVTTRPNRRFVYTETGEEAVPNVGQPYTDPSGNIAFGFVGMTDVHPILAYRAEDVA